MRSDGVQAFVTDRDQAAAERIRFQIRSAIVVGLVTVLGAIVVGWIAYARSHDVLIEGIRLRNLARAQAQATKLEFAIHPGVLRADAGVAPRDVGAGDNGLVGRAHVDEALGILLERYVSHDDTLEDEYMCIVGPDGRLEKHSARPDLVGRDVGSDPFRGAGPEAPATLLELIREKRNWAGRYRALDGSEQIAAFAYAPRTDALVSIHVPLRVVEAEVMRAALPWTIGLALIAGFLLPASLFLLHSAFASSESTSRAAQQASRESEARLRAAVESLPFDFWMLDAAGRCVMQNRASKLVHGDRVGEYTRDMPVPDEVKRRWEENNARAFAGELVVDYHDEPATDGAVRSCQTLITPVRDGERGIGILGVNIDVTELRRSEAAQRTLAERLRILHDIDKAALAARSLPEIANKALRELERLYGFERISLLLHENGEALMFAGTGRIAGAGPVGTRWKLEDVGYESLETLRAGVPVEVADLDQAQPLRPLLARARSTGIRAYLAIPLISQGELFGTLNIARVQTGRLDPEVREVATEVADMLAVAIRDARLEAQLVRQAAELERRVVERTRELSAANAELEGYVHTVSHDLRAPLRAIEGFAQALREDCAGKLEPESRVHLERMIAAAQRMDRLMLDLLDYSRLGRSDLDLQPVDTAQVVADARNLLAGELEEAQAVVSIDEPLLPLVAHAPMLVQAVVNLLGNAAKFVAPGTVPVIRVRTERRDAFVRLSVCDNGIGIAQDGQEKIFQVFERLHGTDAYPGTGIGLAIVRRVVERMGGRVGVDSFPDEGSTFWIELPAPPEPA
jgi:PAS domain S-box-containing protein